jgi:hypothetical protein
MRTSSVDRDQSSSALLDVTFRTWITPGWVGGVAFRSSCVVSVTSVDGADSTPPETEETA